jgi:hypothetical protein
MRPGGAIQCADDDTGLHSAPPLQKVGEVKVADGLYPPPSPQTIKSWTYSSHHEEVTDVLSKAGTTSIDARVSVPTWQERLQMSRDVERRQRDNGNGRQHRKR